jgi:hypothetical protein
MKKTTTKKTAAPAEVAPAFDCNGKPVPNWLEDTPEYDYCLMIWSPDESGDGDPLQDISMTVDEYRALKQHLASIRKPSTVTPALHLNEETADCTYTLEVWDAERGGDQNIQATREEYISLKQHLASMRAKPRRGKAAA